WRARRTRGGSSASLDAGVYSSSFAALSLTIVALSKAVGWRFHMTGGWPGYDFFATITAERRRKQGRAFASCVIAGHSAAEGGANSRSVRAVLPGDSGGGLVWVIVSLKGIHHEEFLESRAPAALDCAGGLRRGGPCGLAGVRLPG